MPNINEQIGKTIKIDNGDESLEGILIKIYTSPENQRNKSRTGLIRIPDGSESDFLVIGTAGYRIITVEVPIDNENINNPILLDILGITTYNIFNEIYTIASIEMEAGTNSRKAIITLANNQIGLDANIEPIFPDKVIEFLLFDDERPSNPYFITNIVSGSNVEIVDKNTLKVKIYKYSNDDVYLTEYANLSQKAIWKGGMSVKQGYTKNGNSEIEHFSVAIRIGYAPSVYINNQPYHIINNIGTGTGEITYYFTAVNGITRNLTN